MHSNKFPLKDLSSDMYLFLRGECYFTPRKRQDMARTNQELLQLARTHCMTSKPILPKTIQELL